VRLRTPGGSARYARTVPGTQGLVRTVVEPEILMRCATTHILTPTAALQRNGYCATVYEALGSIGCVHWQGTLLKPR